MFFPTRQRDFCLDGVMGSTGRMAKGRMVGRLQSIQRRGKMNRDNPWAELGRQNVTTWKRSLMSNKLLLEGRPWDCRNTEPGGNLPGHLKTHPILHRGETEAKRVRVASPRSLLQSGL